MLSGSPRWGVRILTVYLLAALQAPGLAAPSFGADVQPSHGQVKGTVTATPISILDLSFRVDVVANGTLSHIGRIQMDWAVPEVTLDLANLQLVVKNPEWIGTLTAANGDHIFGRYAFRDETIPFSPTGNISFALDLTITGGTGRFKDASGQAVAVGAANLFSGTFTIEVDGEFSRGTKD
jgi:hypothetical protein